MDSSHPLAFSSIQHINSRLKSSPQSKVLVISAQNFRDGGPWTILLSLLPVILEHFPAYIVLVIAGKPIGISHPNLLQILEPWSKTNWLLRLWYEKYVFNKFSRALCRPVSIWLGLHDLTPRVLADRIITYYHNPAPFWRPNIFSFILSPSLFFFHFFYLFICSLDIYSNQYLVCQQSWLATSLGKRFPKLNILVSSPISASPCTVNSSSTSNSVYMGKSPIAFDYLNQDFFLCPVTPRVFKRIEIALKAFSSLPHLSILVTISYDQNIYTRYLHHRFSKFPNIHFIGYVDSSTLSALYQKSKAVVFPSELETWGLPITESIYYDKAIFLPDLPYSRETISDYHNVCYYQPGSSSQLASFLKSFYDSGYFLTAGNEPLIATPREFISFADWYHFLDFIL